MLGICIISNSHANYGNMAYNLAVSIKAAEEIKIAVIRDSVSLSYLTAQQKSIFDYQIDLPEGVSGINTKLHLDLLTPFDKTLYLDADMVWVGYKKPSDLFKEMQGKEFAILTEGDDKTPSGKYYFWADLKEIQSQYKVDKVYQTRSEIMYFEKTKIFKKARELKPEKKLKTIRMFGDHIPDELYFNIAIAVLGLEISKWEPAYWIRLNDDKVLKPLDLSTNYYLLSAGGNYASNSLKKIYDNAMRYAAKKLSVQHMFVLKSKRDWAQGRSKI